MRALRALLTPRVPRAARPRPAYAVAALLAVVFPLAALGQTPADTATHRSVATLQGWAEEVWLSLTDRDGSYFGRLAEEGTFQRFNPLMDPEYELDVRTGHFSLGEDAAWARVRRGFRASGASLNHPFIMTLLDWREEIPVGGNVALRARYRRNRSLTSQRDYMRLGLVWQGVLGTPWSLETGFGVHFFKPSSDVDVTVGRSWSARGGSQWDLNLRLAFLDAFNNVIFKGLGVRPEEVDAHFEYLTIPMAARVSLEARAGPARFEFRGGLSNRPEVEVTFPASGEVGYALEEEVGFAGLLTELELGSSLAVAAFATWARAETQRRHEMPVEGDFTLQEETRIVGLRQRIQAGRAVSLDVELGAVWRPEDRSEGGRSRIRHRDRELFGMVTVMSPPSRGFAWRLSLAGMDRDAGPLAPYLTAQNWRNVVEWGYRFASGFQVMAGLRWDLDQFSRYPFDGGHLRISSSW